MKKDQLLKLLKERGNYESVLCDILNSDSDYIISPYYDGAALGNFYIKVDEGILEIPYFESDVKNRLEKLCLEKASLVEKEIIEFVVNNIKADLQKAEKFYERIG